MKRPKKRNTFKSFVYNYMEENIRRYIIITVILFIGIVLGIFIVNNTTEVQQNEITSYINNFVSSIKNNPNIDKNEIFKNSLISNLKISFILWFFSLTVIGVPLIYILILCKGASIGYTLASIIATLGTGKGIIFLLCIMIQYLIYIPCLLTLAVNGVKFYKNISEDRRKENIKLQIVKHTFFTLIIFVVMAVSSIIEAYISSNFIIEFIKVC